MTQHKPNLVGRILGLALMCLGIFLFHIWFRTLVVTQGFELGRVRREVQKLESELASIKSEKSRLMGPQSLEQWVQTFREAGIEFERPQDAQLKYISPEGNQP
jgi:hypothetical protein